MSKIVFVLGAGSNIEYGFPSGRELIKRICNILVYVPRKDYSPILPRIINDDTLSDDPFIQQLLNNGYSRKYLTEFIDLLKRSDAESIDVFMQNRIEYREFCKIAITKVILHAESNSKEYLHSTNDSFYRKLWGLIQGEFIKSNNEKVEIAFITYNYDRSLEYKLFDSIKALYNKTDEFARPILDKIRIVHVHGQTGTLFQLSNGLYPIDFGEDIIEFNKLKTVSSWIKVIDESIIEESRELHQAKILLKEANKVVFCGFGFHFKNLSRLQLTSDKDIFSTAIGLPISKQRKLGFDYGINFHEEDCFKIMDKLDFEE